MMRRCRFHTAPLVTKTELPRSGAAPRGRGSISGNRPAARAAPDRQAPAGCTGRSGRRACGTRPSTRGRAAPAGPTGCRPEKPHVAQQRDAPRARGGFGRAGHGGHRRYIRGPAARSGWATAARPAKRVGQGHRPGGDAEIVVVAGPVEGAEILEMQPEEPPAQRAPARGLSVCVKAAESTSGQRLPVRGRADSPPPGRTARRRSRRRGPSRRPRSARRACEIGQVGAQRCASGRNDTIGTTCPSDRNDSAGPSPGMPPGRIRSASTDTARCAPEEWPTTSTSSASSPSAAAISSVNGHPRAQLGRVGAAVAGGIGVVVHQVIGEEALSSGGTIPARTGTTIQPRPGQPGVDTGQPLPQPPGQRSASASCTSRNPTG